MAKKLKIYKTMEVEVKIDIHDFLDSLEDNDNDNENGDYELEDLLREHGFIKRQEVGIGDSIVDAAKVEMIKQIMEKATMNQIEVFTKSL